MPNLMLTITVVGSDEKTKMLNDALSGMADVRVVEHDEESRGLAAVGSGALKWVVELLGDTKEFGAKFYDVVKKQLGGSTVKLQCPPGIVIELTNVSEKQFMETLNTAMKFMQSMNKSS
jgi:hypothetical protein